MIKSLGKTVVYSLEPFISKALTFLLIPIYTAHLSVSDYGVLQFVISLGAFIRILSKLGTNSSFWKFSNDKNFLNNGLVLKNLVFIQLFFGSVVSGFLFIISYLCDYEKTGLLLFIYFVALVIKTFSELLLLQFRYCGLASKYLAVSILTLISNISLTLFFVVYLNLGVYGVVLSYLISFSLVCIYTLPNLVKYFQGTIKYKLLVNLVSFGWPLMLGNIFLLFISLSDRWFIIELLGEEQLGQYSYVYKFSDLTLTFLVYSFNIVFVPIMWRSYKKNSFSILFHKIEKTLLIVFPIISLLITLLSIVLATFFTLNQAFMSGFHLIILLSFSHLFYGFYLFQVLKIQMYSKTKNVIFVTAFAALMNLLLNYFLINYYGILGAGIATFISYIILMLNVENICSKIHPTVKNNFNNNVCIICNIIIGISSIELFQIFQTFYERIGLCVLYILSFIFILRVTKILTYQSFMTDFKYIFYKSEKV